MQTQTQSKRIWEVAASLTQDIPVEVLHKLPADGATEHDHYLYGTPKQPKI